MEVINNNLDKMKVYAIFPEKPMLAHAYVPFQQFKEIFEPEVGLQKGTIFPELTNLYGY
jgi:hypothetical protein